MAPRHLEIGAVLPFPGLPAAGSGRPEFRHASGGGLPIFCKMLGTEPVDLLTNTQVWALANHMNHALRPVIQSFAAGSLALQKSNLEHFPSVPHLAEWRSNRAFSSP